MKLLIIGIVASGKTTLANRISLEKNIPHFEIDSIVHDDANNVKRTIEEQKSIIYNIDKNNKSWIIEGTLRKNLDFLLEMADKIIYIDIPLNIRKKRIITRYLKQKIGKEKSNYNPSLKMLFNMFKWTNEYEKDRNQFDERLEKYKEKIIILKSVKETNNYICS